MLTRLIPAVAAGALCVASVAQLAAPPAPKVLFNRSESAPVGWYVVSGEGPYGVGDLIAAYPPAGARKMAEERGYIPPGAPLIKTVWATPGSRVCGFGNRVEVDGKPFLRRLERDRIGRHLQRFEGCFVLAQDELFLVSTDVQTSWDSRYFGPVGTSSVVGKVWFVGGDGMPEMSDEGRARGRGAEGKIKGGGALERATPHLHIFSGGALWRQWGTPVLLETWMNPGISGSAPYPEGHEKSRKAVW